MKVLLLGAGGFAREARVWVENAGHDVMGYYDDLRKWLEISRDQKPIYPHFTTKDWVYLIAVGAPETKILLNEKAKHYGLSIVPAIAHQSVVFGSRVAVGDGSIICPRCVLTTDIRVGRHVLLNLGVTVGHDTMIDDFTTISPGAHISGNVTIGRACYIGTGATIREGVTIGDGATVGMGAVVINDIPDGETWVGVPARRKA